jgi:hypothetical protein
MAISIEKIKNIITCDIVIMLTIAIEIFYSFKYCSNGSLTMIRSVFLGVSVSLYQLVSRIILQISFTDEVSLNTHCSLSFLTAENSVVFSSHVIFHKI